MSNAEYMHVLLKYIPADIIESYKLTKIIVPDEYIYIKIKKGMYSLNKAVVLVYQNLVENLSKHGYTPTPKQLVFGNSQQGLKYSVCVLTILA